MALISRTGMLRRAALALAAVAAVLVAVPVLAAPARHTFVSDLPWRSASGGWIASGIQPAPRRDSDLWDRRLSVAGVRFERGIAAFPVSEVRFDLDGADALLRGDVGLQDGTTIGGASARFQVFVDDALTWDSGVVRQGEPPLPFEAPVAGGRSLRLVLAPGAPDDPGGEGVWGDLRLIAADDFWKLVRDHLNALTEFWQRLRETQRAATLRSAAAASSRLQEILAGAGLPDAPAGAWSGFDAASNSQVLANPDLAVVVSADPQVQGVNILTLPNRTPVLLRGTAALLGQDGARQLGFARSLAQPAAFAAQRNGPHSMTLEARYAAVGGAWRVLLTLSDRGRSLTYQVIADTVDASPVGAVAFFDSERPATLVLPDAEQVEYLTDASMLRRGVISDDGVLRWEAAGAGKPVLVRPLGGPHALLFGVIDPVDVPGRVDFQRQPGAPEVTLGFHQPVRDLNAENSPRLYVEVVPATEGYAVFSGYRAALAQLYPPRPLPAWFRSQWLSWYPSFMDISDGYLLGQADLLTRLFGDLGPWHMIVDAGWYIAEGRPGSDWRTVDPDKFPQGLRAFVDTVHRLGVKVVLFFSAPYLDDAAREGNWLGLRGFIEQHPDWLTELEPQGNTRRYLFNYQHPALRAEMNRLVEGFFTEYGVDGLKLDGLGWGEGEVRDLTARGVWQPQDAARGRGQTLDIYRQVAAATRAAGPDAYIESGWVTPPFAASDAQTFRYGDEFPAWSSAYPFPGLIEHLDYALFQTFALGQRANIGAIYGDPSDPIGTQWLDAALATGAQVSLSFDLQQLAPEALAAYRARLSAIQPFTGTTTVGPGWQPSAVATDQGDRVFLAQINRTGGQQVISTALAALQLLPGPWTAYQPDTDRAVTVHDALESAVPGESLLLTVLRATPGLLWSSSGVVPAATADGALAFDLTGPEEAAGLLAAATAPAAAVMLDGAPLPQGNADGAGAWWDYDAAAGVLRVQYPHIAGGVQRLEILP